MICSSIKVQMAVVTLRACWYGTKDGTVRNTPDQLCLYATQGLLVEAQKTFQLIYRTPLEALGEFGTPYMGNIIVKWGNGRRRCCLLNATFSLDNAESSSHVLAM